MCTLLSLSLKTKIISCFLICASHHSYYCALEPGNRFQRDVPKWVCNAMEVAGIDISECCILAKCQVPSVEGQPLCVPIDVKGGMSKIKMHHPLD
jgi:hypothetical protein